MSFEPKGYVSFSTALSIHGVLDDLVHSIWIATAGGDAQRDVPGLGHVQWIGLPDDLLFGFSAGTGLDYPDWKVAEPEKALCDLLWFCESRGFAIPVHSLRLEGLDPTRLADYADRMMIDLKRLGEL